MWNPFKTVGIPAIEAADLQARLETVSPEAGKPPYLLDVREAGEYKGGRIPGSVLIPMGFVPQRLEEVPKDREIVCICQSGARSGRVAQWLNTQGYTAVNLRGGMLAWRGKVERG